MYHRRSTAFTPVLFLLDRSPFSFPAPSHPLPLSGFFSPFLAILPSFISSSDASSKPPTIQCRRETFTRSSKLN